MKISQLFVVALFFVSCNVFAIETNDIVAKIMAKSPGEFLVKKVSFDDPEMDTDITSSGAFRFQVEFISNGIHYTVWDYDQFTDDDEFLVMYEPVSPKKQVASVFSINERTGEIIDILEAKDSKLIYANYTESELAISNANKIVELHLKNIRDFLKM